ncbi:dipeptide/oligopeptide/nickel ABC transporter permease/ATP-binding protein [Nocardioides sp. AE5]|uniref:dipeptide/oligopeptide/nickel ABC transporter permease/ATP-binding protein n=1 Tax=Nocardioides sp. AE5 TaxID=2962573 RepID=UPI00288150A0|nr:dipeptide/oligopeptide/nickel ABC transporter permease/ATP-binding protein [Nocardioides sp. AE5]MDT0203148.1 dipeptide/oligopeptide/nickel ABC transporter permease/ATP-binding protein [Nocardioides sp. AE5]
MSEARGAVSARVDSVDSRRRVSRGPLFWCCVAWLVVVVVAALFADLLPLADPLQTRTGPPRSGPSSDNLLGTDALGRDLLARVVHGAKVTLGVGLGATAIAIVFGGLVGTVAGYCRGWVDTVVTMIIDAVLAFPSLVVALVVVTFLGSSLMNVTLVLGVLSAPAAARLTRGSTIAIREREFVISSKVLGARTLRTIRRDVVPNILPPVLSFAFLLVGVMIVAEGSLAFLGLSVRPPTPTWGGMIEEGRISLDTSMWATLVPAGVLVITVLALNWIHDVLLAEGGTSRRSRVQVMPDVTADADHTRATDATQLASAGSEPGTDPGESALCLSDVRVTFDTPAGPLHAVDGVTLSVAPGRTLGIVGESGSGKSVLIRSFLRIVGGSAERSGRAWFDGQEVTDLSDAEFTRLTRSRIGMVFQDTSAALNPVRTIGSQMRELLHLQLGLGRAEANERACALLTSVGLSDPERRLKQYPHQLSGGMRQRVLIAMALVGDPVLLLADEPTTALDVTVQDQVLRLLHDVRDDQEAALVLVSHDLPLVAHWADDVVVMYRGRVVESGPAEDVLSHPRMPYTRALLDAVPDPFEDVESLSPISGQPSTPIGDAVGCVLAGRCPLATEICQSTTPALERVAGASEHRFACWHPLETADTDVSAPARGASADGR